MAKELRPILPAEVWLTIDEGSGKVTVKTNLVSLYTKVT